MSLVSEQAESVSGNSPLDVEGGGAVVGVGPGVEFEIVGGGIFWIEADDDGFSYGQLACGEVASFWFVGEIFVPGAGLAMTAGIVKIVGEGSAKVVAAWGSCVPLPFDIEPSDDAVGGGPGERGAV